MIGRIVEVADDKRHVFVRRGLMVVRDTEVERQELGRVPLDDIAAVIANAHGLSYTNNLLVSLAERGELKFRSLRSSRLTNECGWRW